MYPDYHAENPKTRLYVCAWCDHTSTVKLRRLKPIPEGESKFGTVRWQLRTGKTRTQWKRFKQRAYIRKVDLDVPATALNLLRIRMGME